MNELGAKEKDLLERVRTKPELRPLFFRKVKGLHWFDALQAAGYFDANNIPAPVPARDEGYVSIPRWEIAEYLSKTAPELIGDSGAKYAPRFLDVMRDATAYASTQGFSNYQTWWKFSETVSQIPSGFVPIEFINVVDQWLDDKFDRSLVAEQVGNKWLPRLLDEGNAHALDLATSLLEVIYKLTIMEREIGERKKVEVALRIDGYYAKKITESVAEIAGRRLGLRGVRVFQSRLEQALNLLTSDSWSAIWQPAIEEHAQNEHRDDPENLLVEGFRDCMTGFLKTFPDQAQEYVVSLLSSDFQTVQRIAIHCVTENFAICGVHVEKLLDGRFLHSNYRHEFWHFLNRRYALLSQLQREKILTLIGQRQRFDENGTLREGATAYEQATWLAAIKDFGEVEGELYKQAVANAKAQPEHPDFSSYMSSGWVGPQSPYSIDELSALSTKELVTKLANYKERGGWQEPGIEGLSKTFKQLLKASPTQYYPDLSAFSELDLAYVYAAIEAYSELWQEKSNLPWDDIWRSLLKFCSVIVRADGFWSRDNANERDAFVANRHWIVRSIGRLLEAGAKSDEHAFDERYHGEAEAIIAFLLTHQAGEVFREDSDAVSVAINSPRGACIEALLNLTLRACRLADRTNKNHAETWKHFEHYYDDELRRAEIPEYEFSTLVTNYLPNFLYLSREWIHANLQKVFNTQHHLQWLCAAQGYSYVGTVYQEIYVFLKKHGHFLRILDDQNLKKKVSDKVVQNIAVAYLHDFESIDGEDSLIRTLIQRHDPDELSQLVWFIWTLRKEGDVGLRNKVYELWPAVMSAIDVSTKEGKRLASNLCHWSVFVDRLDAERKALLMHIAPYADYSHNSYILLKSLAELSKNQPFEVNEIWLKILGDSAPDYPAEAIRTILENLVSRGEDGKRVARSTVSEYLKRGVEQPSRIFREIIGSQEIADL